MFTIRDDATKNFNWLNLSTANEVISICKLHGAKATRKFHTNKAGKPDKFGGLYKVTCHINLHGWAHSNERMGVIIQAVKDAGLTDQLTFQEQD